MVGLAYQAAWAGMGRVPAGAARSLVDRACDILVERRGPGVVQLARNQRRVLGAQSSPAALHAVVRAAMRSYGRYWLETFRMERSDLDEIAGRALAGSVGLHHITTAQQAGRGVVLALPHSGNWDVAGLSMVKMVGGITTVAERVEPEGVYRRFLRHREGLGFEVLPLTGRAREDGPASAVLRQRLEQGRMVCLLADRALGSGAVGVSFFDEPAAMPAGPAMLAALTGAALCPVHLAFTDAGWIQFIGPPLELPGERLAQQVRAATQAMANMFAERIALFPADWHMLQPVWTADKPARPDPTRTSAPAARSRGNEATT